MCVACQPGLTAFLRAAGSRRDFLRYAGLATAATGLSACGLTRRHRNDGAEVIFRGGPVLTMDETNPRAEALAIANGRILAVGGLAEVDAQRRPGTRIIELAGRTLLPGLIDPHVHASFVLFDDWLDVSPFTTPTYDGVMAKLRQAAQLAGPDQWVRAQGFDPSITRGGRSPTLAELDALSPGRPLFLFESNGHVAWVNSRALQLAGVAAGTRNPPEARYVRDASGALTGRLEEAGAMAPFAGRMPLPSAAEMRMRVRRMFDIAASKGCTALHDCGIGVQAGMEDLRLLDAVMADDPPVRYRGMLVSTAMDVWEREGIRPGRGDDRFKVEGVKVWSNGSNHAFAGFQRRNDPGKAAYTQTEFTDAVRRAHQGGWQVGVHADGVARIDTSLRAFATVLDEVRRPDPRHRIEHCSVLRSDQIEQMRLLGLSPSFLMGHERGGSRIPAADRARAYDPCALALRGGLRISLHSDFGVTPVGPLHCVEDAVTRTMRDGGEDLAPDERMPVEAALRAVTLDAAWQCRLDAIAGSLEPGKYADLTVLEQDPTAIDPARIASIPVSETWLAGVQRYGA